MVLPHPAINHRKVNRLTLGQELLVADHSTKPPGSWNEH